MKLVRLIVLTISFSILCSLTSESQTNYICSNASLAEKIYLQLDGKIYTTDKTIWFKAVVTNAVNHAPTQLSGVLYVELVGPDERLIEKKLIKLKDGVGDGFFELSQKYTEGVYLVRAYTEWNKNFDKDFIFKEYIRLFAPFSKLKTEPITKITLIEESKNERRLSACFDPYMIDSLHKRDLTVYISLDNKKDSFLIRKNAENKYLFEYLIPKECQFVTLQIQTKNLFAFSKTITMDENRLDLQFFPESGELVHGLPGRVGFKALDYNGKGKKIEGEIVNKDGEVMTKFISNELGMGSFILPVADSTTKYFARLAPQKDETLARIYPLPEIVRQGNVLIVNKIGDKIHLWASSNYLKNDSIYLRVSCRGLVHYDLKFPFKNRSLALSLTAKDLPDGIIAFTMMDTLVHPLAERLYFNERPENRIKINLSTDKEIYRQRELTKLNIETKNDNGDAVSAGLSVLVLNKKQLGNIQSTRQNILSYFLLSSELRGEIENPGFYFSKDPDRYKDLDALLLTQGWRKYLYTKPVNKILFQPEPRLTVSGSVGGIIFQKRKKEVELTMMTFGKNRSIHTQRTDSLGRFNFSVNDEYGQNLNILIQSANKSGEKKDYSITLDKKEPPAILFEPIRSVEKVDSVVQLLVEKNIERKKADDTYLLSSGEILLKEIVIESYRMTPDRKKVMDKYGKPDAVIEGKDIQEKEEKWSYGLYSVLLFNFPDQVRIERGHDGNLFARVRYRELTLVVIDGIPVMGEEYPLIQNIPPSEVKSFEIIKYAKNFRQLFFEAYPDFPAMKAPVRGDVIAIYTHAGKGIYGANRAVGIIKAAVPVFSVPRQFYVPKYENLQPTDWYKPDLRALIHWEPNIQVGSTGKATADFYNADTIGEMVVVVEAISDQGEIGYQELDYNVIKNDENREKH